MMAAAWQERPSRLVFGSCNGHDHPQPLWSRIHRRNATAFVWVGDSVYGDETGQWDWSVFPPIKRVVPATPERLERLYRQQRHPQHDYAQYMLNNNNNNNSSKTTTPRVFGTIDDHDYGVDNGDERYEHKKESARLFVEEFLREQPEESLMVQRARRGDGVYGVKLLDFERPVGQEWVPDQQAGIDPDAPNNNDGTPTTPYSTTRSVAIFLLDVRSHKTPYQEKDFSRRYQPDYGGDFLGKRQWEWFEQAIQRSRATIHIVVTGLQVHADRFPDPAIAESWARFPTAQQRLYETTLTTATTTPTVLVSGDVHHAQLLQKDCRRTVSDDDEATIQSLVEMTTSGMTHSWGTNLCSRPGVAGQSSKSSSPVCGTKLFSWATTATMTLAHQMNPWTDLVYRHKKKNNNQDSVAKEEEEEEEGKLGLQYTLQLNYGEWEIDWENQTMTARVLGLDPDASLLTHQWTFQELRPGSTTRLSFRDFDLVQKLHRLQDDQWICVNHRGAVRPAHLHLTTAVALVVVGVVWTSPLIVTLLLAKLVAKLLLPRRRSPPPSPPRVKSLE